MLTEDERRVAERDLRGTATRADWERLCTTIPDWHAYLAHVLARAHDELHTLSHRPTTPERERARAILLQRIARAAARRAYVAALTTPPMGHPPLRVALDEARSRHNGDGWFGVIIRDPLTPDIVRVRARVGWCQTVAQTTLEALRFTIDYLTRWHIVAGRRVIITLDAKFVVTRLRDARVSRWGKGERRAYLAESAVRKLVRDAPLARWEIVWVPRRAHAEADALARYGPQAPRRPWRWMTYYERRTWLSRKIARSRPIPETFS